MEDFKKELDLSKPLFVLTIPPTTNDSGIDEIEKFAVLHPSFPAMVKINLPA